MKSQSIDSLQRKLADDVFNYASDPKKAAGRALGTLVEIITYHTLLSWGLSDHIMIERKVPEFANSNIMHNVEFSLHPIKRRERVTIDPLSLPITAKKILRRLQTLSAQTEKSTRVLGREKSIPNHTKRNAAVLGESDSETLVANIVSLQDSRCIIHVCELSSDPFSIVECKRVGVEDGMKKGPQTIEKAKQGSYVARSVSSLQKIRLRDGQFQGIIERVDGDLHYGPYPDLRRKMIDELSPDEFPGFVLTVGVVSNHGNWFTSSNPNKELRILAQSYDWLLFLTQGY